MKTGKKITSSIQLIFSLGLILAVLYFNKISISEIVGVFENIEIHKVILFVIPILVLDRILMSYKWNTLLHAAGIKISLWGNIKLYMASGFIGMIFPSTIGADLIRSYQLSKSDYSIRDVMASVVVERAFGFVSIGIFAVITASALFLYAPENMDIVLVVFSIVAIMVAAFLIISNKRMINVFVAAAPRLFSASLIGKLSRFISAFSVYREKPDIIFIFIFLTLIETFVPITLAIIFSYIMGLNIDWFVLFLVVPIVLIIVRMPVTVNGIGMIEGVYVMLLGRFGVDSVDAFALGAVMDVTGILVSLAGGVFVFPFFFKKSYTV